MSDTAKLTKKQKKALDFRQKKSKDSTEEDTSANTEKDNKKRAADAEGTSETGEEPKKKRKTRRGKKGKGVNEGKGPRFILFVGNLPYNVTQPELVSRFKNSNPDRIRLRQDKGIAFMEFDNDSREIQSKMELALRMHHSTLRNRKINVELTVGGGGNSDNRVNKLKEKNEKLEDERRSRVTKDGKKGEVPEGVHPSRAALLS
jgi:nucleolar protein 6